MLVRVRLDARLAAREELNVATGRDEHRIARQLLTISVAGGSRRRRSLEEGHAVVLPQAHRRVDVGEREARDHVVPYGGEALGPDEELRAQLVPKEREVVRDAAVGRAEAVDPRQAGAGRVIGVARAALRAVFRVDDVGRAAGEAEPRDRGVDASLDELPRRRRRRRRVVVAGLGPRRCCFLRKDAIGEHAPVAVGAPRGPREGPRGALVLECAVRCVQVDRRARPEHEQLEGEHRARRRAGEPAHLDAGGLEHGDDAEVVEALEPVAGHDEVDRPPSERRGLLLREARRDLARARDKCVGDAAAPPGPLPRREHLAPPGVHEGASTLRAERSF
mmetsp:Transcript_5964/g.24965  ORF Transcript_5964/g.24965 Transcript_5964/m.24965 type:complete len:334 (-) Transcript_5964:8-1009(-)